MLYGPSLVRLTPPQGVLAGAMTCVLGYIGESRQRSPPTGT
jgi:hypothetical protein